MSKTLLSAPLATLEQGDDFIRRHLGPCANELPAMLAAVGVDSLDTLVAQTVPAGIRLPVPLALGEPTPEHVALAQLKAIAGKNVLKKSLIGMGYYDTITPKVILRNVMENPGWYTAYTPLSGRNRAGPPGSATELPADGHRPHRSGARQRLPARRSHRCRRSHGHGPPHLQGEEPGLLRG